MKYVLLLALSLFAVLAVSAEEPILRAGIMTDTHIGETAESCAHVRKAFELFRAQKADLVVNLGDIANEHYPAGYRHYRRIFNEVFPEPRPAELFVFAGHDARGFRDADEAYKIVEKEIGASNSTYGKLVLKGYPFLVFRQNPDLDRYERDIAQAEKEFPDKPIFVLNHEPPHNTTYHSIFWGSRKLRPILEKHPRVVQFSGHAHSSVRDERNIWQGKFTSISAGCLQKWAGMLVGAPAIGKNSDGVLLLEVWPEKLVIRRFEYLTGKEYGADKRWVVPLPFDEKTAPYPPERRNAATPAPEFAAGAVLKTTLKPEGVIVQYPEASDGVAEYRINLEKCETDGKWTVFARYDQFSGFYLHEPPKQWSVPLDAGYFTPGEKYRVRVYPMSFWRKCGKPLEAEFTAPPRKEAQVVLDCADPMKDLPFKFTRNGKNVPQEGGFYLMKSGADLTIPERVWEDAPKNARFRLIADIRFEQSDDIAWTMMTVNPQNRRNLTMRIGTVPGDAGMMRYVAKFNLPDAGNKVRAVLRFAGGDPAKVRFGRIRIERLR